MASSPSPPNLLTPLLLLLSLTPIFAVNETTTHLHFYFHDIPTSTNPTAIRVAQAPTTSLSKTGFGALVMMDDPLTEGPNVSSKLIGHAQGIYGSASQEGWHLLMALTFAFEDGEFNGSTVAVLGRNSVELPGVREMPVVGGTGKFRMARGYTQAKTYSLDMVTGNAVVEYDVYVTHQVS